MGNAKQTIKHILSLADVTINGTRPWDIQVHNEGMYARVLAGGSLALGESYMDGWWDCERLDLFISKVISARLDKKIKPNLRMMLTFLQAKLLNMQTKVRSKRVATEHYDAGNDLFKNMLDKSMTYTCGYWKNAKNLDQAQEAKLDLVCKKIGLKPGMTVLDIGCGFGSFVKYAAQKYKIKAVGITISKEQAKLARESCKGLPIEIRLKDYRSVNEKFDRVISIGMFEAVGYKNFRHFMKIADRCLKPDGLFLLHTIGSPVTEIKGDPWSEKYIFPNGMLPSLKQFGASIEGLFIVEDLHNFGAYYYKTIRSWEANFRKNWNNIKHQYDDRFYRMWIFYLTSFAGAFHARKLQLWQIVMSKKGVPGGYESIR